MGRNPAKTLGFLERLAAANVVRAPDFAAGALWDWSPAERGNELAGETGELCNELKKLLRHCKRFGVDYRDAIRDPRNAEQMAKIRAELGDVVICASLIAVQLLIDLEDATREKFNATSLKIGSGVTL